MLKSKNYSRKDLYLVPQHLTENRRQRSARLSQRSYTGDVIECSAGAQSDIQPGISG